MNELSHVAVYLAAAVVCVAAMKRVGYAAVLGYLLAGAAIGPWGLGMIDDINSVRHLSEFGVVLLLFVIGLELQPSRLWELRRPVFGLCSGRFDAHRSAGGLATDRGTGNRTWPRDVFHRLRPPVTDGEA